MADLLLLMEKPDLNGQKVVLVESVVFPLTQMRPMGLKYLRTEIDPINLGHSCIGKHSSPMGHLGYGSGFQTVAALL